MDGQTKQTGSESDELMSITAERRELLAKVIEFFPYPVQFFSRDGTVRMANKATLDIIGIKSLESHIGKYNVFLDPIVKTLGATEKIRDVLKGKTVCLTDFNAPYPDLVRYFDVRDRDIQIISADITCFPVVRLGEETEYFAAVFFIKKIYKGKEEIEWGKQYIESHWMEPFDANATAKAACLSKAHFTKLELQTSGVGMKTDTLTFLKNTCYVSTIILSLSDMFDSAQNATYNNTRKGYEVDIENLCHEVKQNRFNLRLNIILTNSYKNKTIHDIVRQAKKLKADQVLLKVLYSNKNKKTPQGAWIEKYGLDGEKIAELVQELDTYGKRLITLHTGAALYSMEDIAVSIDHDCMFTKTDKADFYRYLSVDYEPQKSIECIERATRLVPTLLNSRIIYGPGAAYNPYSFQDFFVSSYDNVCSILSRAYRNLGKIKESDYWRNYEIAG